MTHVQNYNSCLWREKLDCMETVYDNIHWVYAFLLKFISNQFVMYKSSGCKRK